MRVALLTLVFVVVGTPLSALAQGVELNLRNGFNGEGSAFVLVEVVNRSARAVRGTLELSINETSGGQRLRVGADVPPRDRRVFQFETGELSGFLKARLREEGRLLGQVESWNGSNSNSIVIFADPPRIQSSAGRLSGSRDTSYGPEAFDYSVGTVDFNAAGDPIVPRRVEGWRGVDLILATAAELARLDAGQLEALHEYVFAGGRLLISPSAPEEVRLPAVQHVLGDVHVVGDGYTSADPLWQPEYFGGGRPLGFGYVWICAKDVNAPSAVGSSRVESLLGRLVARAATVRPQIDLYKDESPNDWQGHTSFRDLRSALDPNASFRPALGLVAVLLLLYVLAVGPLNFRFVQKRGNPTLALLTTPVLSFGCLVLMLLVGFIGKGVTMRHRTITWVESLAGEDEGLRRTYHGLYSTRPATFDLEAEGMTRFAGNPNVALVHEIGPSGEESLTNIRASLWSTTLVREVEVTDFQPVDFTLSEGELTSVVNRGEAALLDAVIVGSGGRVFQVGDINPGMSASIPATPAFFASPGSEDGIARSLGFDEDREEIVGGQLRFASVLGVNAPTLYARVEQSEGTLGLFAEESSSMIISVQAPAQELPIGGGDASAWRIGTGPLADGTVGLPQREEPPTFGEILQELP